MHLAAAEGHLEIVKYLMTSHASMFSMSSMGSPLHLAISRGKLDIVKYMLETNHENNIIIFPDDLKSLLHTAAEHGKLEVARYLIRDMKYDPTLKDDSLNTPLHYACLGKQDLMKIFPTLIRYRMHKLSA